jgi:hypothetical protein
MENHTDKITDEDFIKLFGCDRETYDKKLCDNEYKILKEREKEYEYLKSLEEKQIGLDEGGSNAATLVLEDAGGSNATTRIIVIAYFHYDTLRSDIELFHDENTAKEWLYDRWGFLLNREIPSTLKELIELCSEKEVTIEIIKKNI